MNAQSIMNSALSLSGIRNDVFFLSGAADSSNELNLCSDVTNAVTIQEKVVKPFVLKSEESAAHYRLEEPDDTSNSVGSAEPLVLPDLEHGKYIVEVVQEDCQFVDGTYTEDVSNDAPITFSANEETYISQHFFATHNISSSMECEKVISLPNYSSREYVLYSDSGLENGNAFVEQSDVERSNISNKHSNKFLKRSSKLQKISPLEFKKQLVDTSDIVSPLILLPHSKQLMEISSWNFNNSLVTPQRSTCKLFKNCYQRNCISSNEENEIDTSELKLLPLGYKPQIDLASIKRIIRKRKNPHILKEETSCTTIESTLCAPMESTSCASIESTSCPAIESTSCATIKSQSQFTKEQMRHECEETPMEYVEGLLGNDNVHDQCFFFEADIRDAEEIIVIHDGHETAESTAYTHQNIDVLLAAAAKNNSKSIVIRKQSKQPTPVTQNTNRKGIVKGNGPLIIV